jgi:predicted double-glycine peptidase
MLTAALLLACAALAAFAQDGPRPAGPPQSARGKLIIRQTGPATCGPAALATLLTFYLDDPVTEAEMVALTGTDRKTMSKMSELVNASHARGHKANGYCLGEYNKDDGSCRRPKLPDLLGMIERRGVPVLVHFKEPTQHFVLAVGGVGDFILVADPAHGEVAMHLSDFLRRWDGFVLVVTPSRPVEGGLAERRRRSAETRLETLRRAGSLMSVTRF